MLPFHPADIADWPVEARELEDGYRGVMSFVPCSGADDALGDLFPHYSAGLEMLRPSRQGQAFLHDAARSAAPLRQQGIVTGQSRLAVNGGKCRRCGMCLYGCPYELIYNSAFTLRELQALPNFRYQAGFVVDRLVESGGAVSVEGHDLNTRVSRRFEAERVLLGAGVIPSTAILLRSLQEFDAAIRLQDSFYFLLPLLRFAGVPGLPAEELHALAQAFLVMREPEAFVHFSIYGYNDLLPAALGAAGKLGRLVSRTLVAGGYLHSRLSPGIRMTLRQDGRVLLEGEDSSEAIRIARRAAGKLLRQSFRLRAVPLAAAMRFSPPGRGFHTGASFPMRSSRAPHTSDIDGRPFGFDRVHLIDASCLPSIPATTITLPVMANAWRIAGRL